MEFLEKKEWLNQMFYINSIEKAEIFDFIFNENSRFILFFISLLVCFFMRIFCPSSCPTTKMFLLFHSFREGCNLYRWFCILKIANKLTYMEQGWCKCVILFDIRRDVKQISIKGLKQRRCSNVSMQQLKHLIDTFHLCN